MKLFEVLSPLMESKARIEKTAEKYAFKMIVVMITDEYGRTDEESVGPEIHDTIQVLDDDLSYISGQMGRESDYEDNYDDPTFMAFLKDAVEKDAEEEKELIRRVREVVEYMATNFDPTQNHMYLDWIVRMYTKNATNETHAVPPFRLEDDELVSDVLEVFHKNKKHLSKKDINQYKSFTELKEAVEPFMAEEGEEKIQEMVATGEAELVYDQGGEKVFIPHTAKAAKVLSQGTEWCTQYPRMYEEYSNEGPLYIIYANNGRYQFHFESEQFMNIQDKQIDVKSLMSKSKAVAWVMEKYKEEYVNAIESGNVSDPSSAALKLLGMGLVDVDWVMDAIENSREGELAYPAFLLARNHGAPVEWAMDIIENDPDPAAAEGAAHSMVESGLASMKWYDENFGDDYQ